MNRRETIDALHALQRQFEAWDKYNIERRQREGLDTTDDTHVITVPPHWPSHGSLRQWVEILKSASEFVEDG